MPNNPDAVRAILTEALGRAKLSKRHPAEVTSDRLGDAASKWTEHFTGDELDMIARIRQRLEEIAEKAGHGD